MFVYKIERIEKCEVIETSFMVYDNGTADLAAALIKDGHTVRLAKRDEDTLKVDWERNTGFLITTFEAIEADFNGTSQYMHDVKAGLL